MIMTEISASSAPRQPALPAVGKWLIVLSFVFLAIAIM